MTTTNIVPIIWENSIENFDKLNLGHFYSHLTSFAEEFNKEFPLTNIEIHLSRPAKEAEFATKNFIIKLHLHLKNGQTVLASAQDSHLNLALKKVLDEVHHQTQLSDRQKHNLAGRQAHKIKIS